MITKKIRIISLLLFVSVTLFLGCSHYGIVKGIFYSEELSSSRLIPVSKKIIDFSDTNIVIIYTIYDTSFFHTDYYVLRTKYCKATKSTLYGYNYALKPLPIDPLNLPYKITTSKTKNNDSSIVLDFNNLYCKMDWRLVSEDTIINIVANHSLITCVGSGFYRLQGIYNYDKIYNMQDTIMTKTFYLSKGYKYCISLLKQFEGIMYYNNYDNEEDYIKNISPKTIYTYVYRDILIKKRGKLDLESVINDLL